MINEENADSKKSFWVFEHKFQPHIQIVLIVLELRYISSTSSCNLEDTDKVQMSVSEQKFNVQISRVFIPCVSVHDVCSISHTVSSQNRNEL